MTLDQRAQLMLAFLTLIQSNQRESLVQLCSRSLRVPAESFQQRVVVVDRGGIVFLLVGNLTQVKLRRTGRVVQRIVVHYVLKFSLSYLVPSGSVVAHARLQRLLQRRSLQRGISARRWSRRHGALRTRPGILPTR